MSASKVLLDGLRVLVGPDATVEPQDSKQVSPAQIAELLGDGEPACLCSGRGWSDDGE